MKSTLTKTELQRYARHITIPGFGEAAQLKLKQAKVLVVGAGGLGSPLLLYLAAAGVGTIGIVDDDVVDMTNLQRQVLFTTADIGRPKVEVAKERLMAMNPNIVVETFQQKLISTNAERIAEEYDIIADGTDNFPTRYLVNDLAVLLDKVNVFGAIFRFDGQVAVFNYLKEDGTRSANYRDLFPQPPPPDLIPNCAEGGVLGVLPGIVGSMQANEVIKVITGVGEPLVDKVFLFDAKDMSSRSLKIKKRPDTKIERLIDYDLFCGLSPHVMIQEMSKAEFLKMKNNQEPYLLVDVREVDEYERFNIGGRLIPLGEIEYHVDELPADRPVVIHCQSGNRSCRAIERIMDVREMENLYNLTGGVSDW